jgi:hypothetical protein
VPLLLIIALTLASQMQLDALVDQIKLFRHPQILLVELPVVLVLFGQEEHNPEGRI